MALYEYLCRTCGSTFELRRSIGEADRDVVCPDGHGDVRRKLSVFASVGGSTMPSGPPTGGGGGGGCCGGACGCGR